MWNEKFRAKTKMRLQKKTPKQQTEPKYGGREWKNFFLGKPLYGKIYFCSWKEQYSLKNAKFGDSFFVFHMGFYGKLLGNHPLESYD